MSDTRSNRHVDLAARDANSVLGWRYEPRIVLARGSGVTVTDVDGNDYYDLSSGMMCMALGHSHPELTEVIRENAELMVHECSWYTNEASIKFAELLTSTLPDEFEVVNFAVTGSEANEIAMRMAIAQTGHHDIVSVLRGLHGGSLAVEAVTSVGGERKGGLGPLMMPARSNAVLAPFCYRCPVNLEYPDCDINCLKLSEDIVEHMTSKSIAAFMAEPILVPGGMVVPPKEWLPRLHEMAKRWGALLVVDEAQLAPARTGKLWGFQHSGVTPDIITFAKGMSAGFAICGTITTKAIAEQTRGQLGLPWAGTYSGDPLAAAVAHKSLEIVLRDNLTESSAVKGKLLADKLEAALAKFDFVGDIRGEGLYRMLDIVDSRANRRPDYMMAERIRYNAVAEGLLMICVKNYMRVSPPLIVTEAQIDEIVGRLARACQRAADGFPHDINFSSSGSLAASEPLEH